MADEIQNEEEVAGETPVAEKDDSDTSESVIVPKQFAKLIKQVETMSVLELHELVKVLEKRFGVSASAVATAAPGGTQADSGVAEQDSFTVELTVVGEAKIQVIKAVKEVLALGLKEAKDLVDAAPSVLKEGLKKEDAEALKIKIEAAGATVTLK